MNEVIVKCFMSGFICVAIHSLFRAEGLKKDANAANMDWHKYKEYLKNDWMGIAASFLSVILWYLIFGEISMLLSKLKIISVPLEEIVICSYGVVGFIGSYFLQQSLGKSKNLIRSFVDEKTNQLQKLINKNTEMEELEYYFTIPDGGIAIGDATNNTDFETYAANTGGLYEENEMIYFTEPTSRLAVLMSNNESHFVGHVPRPRKPR